MQSQELRVAGGATNREAATALLLSPKTVDAHLESIYRKLASARELAVTRRSQIARLFAQGAAPPAS